MFGKDIYSCYNKIIFGDSQCPSLLFAADGGLRGNIACAISSARAFLMIFMIC